MLAVLFVSTFGPFCVQQSGGAVGCWALFHCSIWWWWLSPCSGLAHARGCEAVLVLLWSNIVSASCCEAAMDLQAAWMMRGGPLLLCHKTLAVSLGCMLAVSPNVCCRGWPVLVLCVCVGTSYMYTWCVRRTVLLCILEAEDRQPVSVCVCVVVCCCNPLLQQPG